MAKKKYNRGHRSIETRPVQKRYLGFFKAKHLNLELVPYLILAGMFHSRREALSKICTLSGVAKTLQKKSSSDLLATKKELIDYVDHELPYIKGYNTDTIYNLLRIGATLLKGKKAKANTPWKEAHKLVGANHKAKHGKLMRYILNGKRDIFWYENTRLAFEAFLPGYDIELFIKLFAMTSPRTNFPSNIKSALKGYDMFVGKTAFEKKGFLGAIFSILTQVRDGKFEFKLGVRGSKRKINNFKHSISGEDCVTADMWITMAFGLLSYYVFRGKRFPYTVRDSEYDVIEAYIRGLSSVTGFKAKQINAMMWLGKRQEDYNRHVTTDSATLLINAIGKHGDKKLQENASNKIIMTTPAHLLDDHIECLDFSKPALHRVYLVRNSKQDSTLYRTFDGKPKRHCSGCSSSEGCVVCTLP